VPPADRVEQAGVFLHQRLKRLDRRRPPRSPLRLAAPLPGQVTRVGASGMPTSARITSWSSKDPGRYSALFSPHAQLDVGLTGCSFQLVDLREQRSFGPGRPPRPRPARTELLPVFF
jgi:hypothetical protein